MSFIFIFLRSFLLCLPILYFFDRSIQLSWYTQSYRYLFKYILIISNINQFKENYWSFPFLIFESTVHTNLFQPSHPNHLQSSKMPIYCQRNDLKLPLHALRRLFRYISRCSGNYCFYRKIFWCILTFHTGSIYFQSTWHEKCWSQVFVLDHRLPLTVSCIWPPF